MFVQCISLVSCLVILFHVALVLGLITTSHFSLPPLGTGSTPVLPTPPVTHNQISHHQPSGKVACSSSLLCTAWTNYIYWTLTLQSG